MADETIVTEEAATETATETQQTAQAEAVTEATTETATETTETTADIDWRSRMAGGDEKALAWLGRYQSEAAFVADAKKRFDDVRNGKFRKPLSENPTPDELAAYRADHGIPENPEGYLEKLPDGLVVGDDDRPAVDKFVAAMHERNAPKAVVEGALSAYYEIVEEQQAAEADLIRQAESTAIEELRADWGADYKRNLNVMTNYLETLPEAVRDVFSNGRMLDGTPIGYNPEVLRWLTAKALEENPIATVVPGAGANQASAIADEIASIEKMMGNPGSDYWKGPKSSKLQERYRELVTARDKLK